MNANILVTAAGRRVSFVRGFQQIGASQDRRVFASDSDPTQSAACQISDGAHWLPHASEPEFVDVLFELCQRLSIGLVVPTIDTELPVLSEARARFEESGIHIAVSDRSFIADCEDKRRTGVLFDRLGLARSEVYNWPDVPGYPLFAKPYDGSASQGTSVLHNATEAELALAESDRLMICDYFDPVDHDEFTVDCYFDRASTLRCAVPRQRLEVRGGEVAKAITCKNELVIELFDRMNQLQGARGIITVQAFVERQKRTSSYIEINARVGGGYPLTRIAGADYQQLLIDEYLNERTPDTLMDWRDRALMLRYDAEVVRFDV